MDKITHLKCGLVALAAVALAGVPFGRAQAQAWPAHPIEFVCATSAGSGAAPGAPSPAPTAAALPLS